MEKKEIKQKKIQGLIDVSHKFEEKLKILTEKQLNKNDLIKLMLLNKENITKIDRVRNCAIFIESVSNEDNSKNKIVKSNRCKNRFCPICNATKSAKIAYKLDTMIKYIKYTFEYNFLFLTLTVPNVKEIDLKKSINELNKSLNKFYRRKEIENINMGLVKKIEITYNKRRKDFHPHIHLLIAVPKEYFSKEHKYYLEQKRILKIWKEVSKNDKITQVDVRKADENSFLEMSKYMVKDSDFLKNGLFVYKIFYEILKGRRMLAFTGIFENARRLFETKKLKQFEELEMFRPIFLNIWHYSKEQYLNLKNRNLSEEEIVKYENMAIMEEDIFSIEELKELEKEVITEKEKKINRRKEFNKKIKEKVKKIEEEKKKKIKKFRKKKISELENILVKDLENKIEDEKIIEDVLLKKYFKNFNQKSLKNLKKEIEKIDIEIQKIDKTEKAKGLALIYKKNRIALEILGEKEKAL